MPVRIWTVSYTLIKLLEFIGSECSKTKTYIIKKGQPYRNPILGKRDTLFCSKIAFSPIRDSNLSLILGTNGTDHPQI